MKTELKSTKNWTIGELFSYEGRIWQFDGYCRDTDCWYASSNTGTRKVTFSSPREWKSLVNT